MHPEIIKASLRMKKISPAFIAAEQGVTRQMVSSVINGRSRSSRIENRISEILGKSVAEIWPDRQKPLPRASEAKANRAKPNIVRLARAGA